MREVMSKQRRKKNNVHLPENIFTFEGTEHDCGWIHWTNFKFFLLF